VGGGGGVLGFGGVRLGVFVCRGVLWGWVGGWGLVLGVLVVWGVVVGVFVLGGVGVGFWGGGVVFCCWGVCWGGYLL